MSGKSFNFKVSDTPSTPLAILATPRTSNRPLPTPPRTPRTPQNRTPRALPRPPSQPRPQSREEEGEELEEEKSVVLEPVPARGGAVFLREREMSQAQAKWQFLPEELRPPEFGEGGEEPEDLVVGGVRYRYCSLNRQESQLDLQQRANAPNAKFVAVQILGGKDLVKKDLFSSDPYVKIGLLCDENLNHFITPDEEVGRTVVVKKTLNPVFPPQKWIIDPYKNGALQNLVFEVWDWDLATTDDFMGRCVVNLERADQLKTILGCVQILNTFVLDKDGLNTREDVGGCLKMAIAWARDSPD